MTALFLTIFNMQFRLNYNKAIYYFQKFPFLGKYIPDSLYKGTQAKKSLSILLLIFTVLQNLVKKILFFSFLYFMSIAILFVSDRTSLTQPTVFISLLLFNVLISGTASKMLFINTASQQDLVAIKLFRIPPKAYYLAQFIFEYIQYIVFNSLVGAVFFYLQDIPVWYAPLLFICVAGIRLFSQAAAIQFYRWGLNPKKEFWTWVMIMASVISWSLSLIIIHFDIYLPVTLIPSIWFILISILLFVLGILGWKQGNVLNPIAYQVLSFETLKTHMNAVDTINTTGLTLEETDYKGIRNKEALESKVGIDYLNAHFFERTRHHLKKHIRRRFLFTFFGVLSLLILYVVVGESIPDSQTFLYVISFISFIASQYFYYGEEFSKFCFYNLDRKLMKYRFYRNPDIVMESIKIRFIKALKLNTPVLLVLMSATILLFVLTETIALWALLLTLGFQVLLMVFFSLNYLILYYLLQPYTESMKTKSPVYTTINFVFLSLFFVVIYSDVALLPVIIPILAVFMLIYLPIGLLAVYKLAPQQFKLRL